MQMRLSGSRFIFLSLLTGSSAMASPPAPLLVLATLVELPRTDPCTQDHNRVVTRYRLEQVLQGTLPHDPLYVVHRCPEYARGSSRLGKGTAGPLKAGQTHQLKLIPLTHPAGLIDRFTDDPRPRYQALETDPGPLLPLIVVKVSGGAGSATRIDFEALQVTIGRAMDCDVLLSDESVALHHLSLAVKGDKIIVEDLSGRGSTTINGKPINSPRMITYRDSITVGLYTLSVSLLAPRAADPDPADG